MRLLNRTSINFLVHLFCWLIFAAGVLFYHPFSWDNPVPVEFWIKQSILLIILIGVFYLNFYVLIPKFLIQKKIAAYIVSALLLIVAVTLLNNFINSALNLNDFIFNRPHPPHGPPGGRHGHFDTFVPGMNLLMIGLGISISFILKWQQEVVLRQQLEQDKISSELTLLKAQINPHFFFNTLNNIYSYTLSDGDVARTAITNLSKMMRYVLYDAANGLTPVSKEIAFIRDYIALMRLRITAKTKVEYVVSKSLKEYMVAPMLFLPFVENAFKHGISNIDEGYILIAVMQNDDNLELTVTNTVYEIRRTSEDTSNGIGIINTTRRLELLYPAKYHLSTGMISETEYQAKLTLFL